MKPYSQAVWQRFRAPRNAGALAAAMDVHTGRARAPGGAQVLELDVCVRAGIITRAAFRAHGCPATVAAADWLCDRIAGERLDEAATVQASDIEQGLRLTPEKRHCCLLAVDALGTALAARVTVGPTTAT